ncbi:MAG: hypothetical protein RR389_04410 [Christensenella sp.]
MSNKKVSECLEQHSEGLDIIQYFMKCTDELTYNCLMSEINIDRFDGYECLLPVMLLSSEDPIIERTYKRLLLQLYSEKLRKVGGRRMVDCVTDILTDEKAKWDKRIKRLRKLDKQNKL